VIVDGTFEVIIPWNAGETEDKFEKAVAITLVWDRTKQFRAKTVQLPGVSNPVRYVFVTCIVTVLVTRVFPYLVILRVKFVTLRRS